MNFKWSIDGKMVSLNDIISISPIVAYKAQWCADKFLKFQSEFPDAIVFLNYSTVEKMFKATADVVLLALVSFEVADEKTAAVN